MTLTRSKLFLILAVLAGVLGAIASEQGEDVIWNAVTWLCIAVAALAAAFI